VSDRAVNAIITLHFNESLNSDKDDWQLLSFKIIDKHVTFLSPNQQGWSTEGIF